MAVLAEALSVVVQRQAIVDRYPGGWPAFVANETNNTLCADTELARVGFMHPDDVEAFIVRLERLGFVFLDASGGARDLAVVDQREGLTTPCKWLKFFHAEVPGGSVAGVRLVGGNDSSLTCPEDWDFEHSLSNQFHFVPEGKEQEEGLKFLRHEVGLDVYLNRATGREEYVVHAARSGDRGEVADLYREAVALMEPAMRKHFEGNEISPDDRTALEHCAALLQQVTSAAPDNWNVWWVQGMTCQMLDNHHDAYEAFRRSFELAPFELETGRNLASECIALGYGPEALEVATALTTNFPGRPDLIANRALALLINGRVAEARVQGFDALQIEPGDTITQNLLKLIAAVEAGHVDVPTRWPPA